MSVSAGRSDIRPAPGSGPGPIRVSFHDVLDASRRIDGVARRTPVVTSATFDATCGAEVFFKCESFQRTGSFKFRGAYNACARLSAAERRVGVLTYSSGNHAQAVALACQLLDVPVTVIMPDDAPPVKIEATRGYGASVMLYDRSETTREDLATRMATEHHLTIIPPYDHPHIVAGQGTAALEFFESVEDLEMILAPCGGGGLLSGTALVASAVASCPVVGVEPLNADDATRSFESGVLTTIQDPQTIADGARTPSLGAVTFPIVLKMVDQMVTVSDEEILDATRFIWERMKIVVEPTGALAAAALLSGRVDVRGAKVGVLLSGGNLDFDRLASLASL